MHNQEHVKTLRTLNRSDVELNLNRKVSSLARLFKIFDCNLLYSISIATYLL